jgi:hypothetical protein
VWELWVVLRVKHPPFLEGLQGITEVASVNEVIKRGIPRLNSSGFNLQRFRTTIISSVRQREGDLQARRAGHSSSIL